MKYKIFLKDNTFLNFVVCILILMSACQIKVNSKLNDEAIWRLGWRMVENSWNENVDLAEIQFDTLLSLNKELEYIFLIEGLEAKSKGSKTEEMSGIIKKQSAKTINRICAKAFAKGLECCDNVVPEKVENKALQVEIMKMFLDDQAIRGNLMTDFIEKYGFKIWHFDNWIFF